MKHQLLIILSMVSLLVTFPFNLLSQNNIPDVIKYSLPSSQGSNVSLPEFQYKSPEVAAIQRASEIHVNEYAGTAGISIPIYNIEEKDLCLPLVLSYDASGIRVDQEATWVGLGWNLTVGGCVTLVAQGGCDGKHARHGTASDYLSVLNYNSADCFTIESNLRSIPYYPDVPYVQAPFEIDIAAGLTETDYYCASFLGQTIFFFLSPSTGEYEVVGDDSHPYRITANGDISHGPSSWTIIDGDGFRYEFDSVETTWEGEISYSSAWNLTSIISPKGNILTISYSGIKDVMGIPPLYQYYDYVEKRDVIATEGQGYPDYPLYDEGLHTVIGGGNWKVSKRYPKSVTTDGVTVTFSISPRADQVNAMRLDTITVSSFVSGDIVHKYVLCYSYLESCTKGGNYLAYPQKDYYQPEDLAGFPENIKLRLRLDSIMELSSSSGHLSTSFAYHDGVLPLKTSCSKDYWGYYNGCENINNIPVNNSDIHLRHTTIPSPSLCLRGHPIPAGLPATMGANRSPDLSHARIGSLQSITYPTGGHRDFTYGLHQFRIVGASGSAPSTQTTLRTINVSDINFPADTAAYVASGPDMTKEFYVSVNTNCSINLHFHATSSSILRQMASMDAKIVLASMSSNSVLTYTLDNQGATFNSSDFTKDLNISLTAGRYILIAYLPDGLGNYNGPGSNCVSGSLSYYEILNITGDPVYSTGAGLRIEQISDYDSDDRYLGSISYSYENPSCTTSGILLSPISVAQTHQYLSLTAKSEGYMGMAVRYDIIRLSSSPCGVTSYTSSALHGLVGYTYVSCTRHGPDDASEGSTTMSFVNRPAQNVSTNLYLPLGWDNGNLLTVEHRSPAGELLRRVTNTYQSTFGHRKSCIHAVDRICRGVELFQYGFPFYKRYRLCVYSYNPQWSKLIKTETFDYSENAEMSETHVFTYLDSNRCLHSDSCTTSTGSLLAKTYSYPCDMNDTVSSSMVSRHMLSPVIRSRESLVENGTERVLRTSVTEYGVFNSSNGAYSTFVAPRRTLLSTGGISPECRINYGYDSHGNMIYATKDSVEHVVFLWSYRHSYPVAEIRGATYEEVAGWLSSSWIHSLSYKLQPTMSDLESLRTSLSSHPVIVTTYSYAPLLGLSTKTMPNGTMRRYTYDDYGRLSTVSDGLGKIIQTHQYHYKQ